MKYGAGILTPDEFNKIGEEMEENKEYDMSVRMITLKSGERLILVPHFYGDLKVWTIPDEELDKLGINES